MKTINSYCVSSFLTFRYVIDKNQEWAEGWKPWWPETINRQQINVNNTKDVISVIESELSLVNERTGILLSGGIDSAILAAFLPKGTKAFTIRFVANGAIDESQMAHNYAKHYQLDHHIIDVNWDDFLKYSPVLINHKKSALHAIEVGLFKAAMMAKSLGINRLIVGNGADSTFGGMDKLLSKDYTLYEFIRRYSFVDLSDILDNPVNLKPIYADFCTNNKFNVQAFLKKIHGEGIIQTFCNPIFCAGLDIVEPYEAMNYTKTLDLDRIRGGESKYVLRELFSDLYRGFEIPEKIPFARPMDQWLRDWTLPKCRVFKQNATFNSFTGDQKWLLYSLNQLIKIIDEN